MKTFTISGQMCPKVERNERSFSRRNTPTYFNLYHNITILDTWYIFEMDDKHMILFLETTNIISFWYFGRYKCSLIWYILDGCLILIYFMMLIYLYCLIIFGVTREFLGNKGVNTYWDPTYYLNMYDHYNE